jgi:predicted TIM-barrel fold metal-dependent hydrolase
MEEGLDFFDCNAWLGRPMNPPGGMRPDDPFDAEGLIGAMDRAGVGRAIVWHAAQRDSHPATGNRLLAEAIRGYESRLLPSWAFLPPHTREMGDLREYFGAAREAGVVAFRAFPDVGRYLFRYEAVGEVIDELVAARIPLILRVPGHVNWDNVYDLLMESPELIVILTGMGQWGSDRYFRPLLARYPDVYVELGGYITDGGIEALVEDYGAGHLVFGSGYPDAYMGSMMLALKHARISDEEKRAIAGGTLERLLAEARR